jgi:hypothetical protein
LKALDLIISGLNGEINFAVREDEKAGQVSPSGFDVEDTGETPASP